MLFRVRAVHDLFSAIHLFEELLQSSNYFFAISFFCAREVTVSMNHSSSIPAISLTLSTRSLSGHLPDSHQFITVSSIFHGDIQEPCWYCTYDEPYQWIAKWWTQPYDQHKIHKLTHWRTKSMQAAATLPAQQMTPPSSSRTKRIQDGSDVISPAKAALRCWVRPFSLPLVSAGWIMDGMTLHGAQSSAVSKLQLQCVFFSSIRACDWLGAREWASGGR